MNGCANPVGTGGTLWAALAFTDIINRKATMQIIVLYVAACGIFLVLDALMLTFVMRPLFERHLGDLMLEKLRLVPAAIFYLGYVAGLTYVVSWPALRAGDPWAAIVPAAIVGAMAYGTYEFTSYTIMKVWHPSLVIVDVAWGTVATALVAAGSVWITRALTA
jgi:uncharacterized membrane protein